ncbi:MAG: DEAD/DEAH box helicase [Kiritimatiellae bacterium]|nr:DEAD/DEAH box helicase [Kiritimatiellia bacterium]
MDVFGLRDKLVTNYSGYVRSFVSIQDARISERVNTALDSGLLWPEPLIQMNPSFAHAESVDDLVNDGVLHEECRNIFRLGKHAASDTGKELRLHQHQADAIKTARKKQNYILSTGTGSGKSLSYIIPIVDSVLRSGPGKGIQAIIVYPMNALANSQFGELKKFLSAGYADGRGPISFERYTGQENRDQKNRILSSPPDILLTNYMMLELILTRPEESAFVEAAQGLRFLVLDELHTYRGRQGADVALLVRRVRDRLSACALQCVGTSATLATAGSYADQQEAIAKVATNLFGATVDPSNVIGETLCRTTRESNPNDSNFIQSLSQRVSEEAYRVPTNYSDFCADPLASWIETTFGITLDKSDNRFVRATPRSIGGHHGAATDLEKLTGIDTSRCITAIKTMLLAGYKCENPETGFPVFAFRLHQFISRGDTAYASLGNENDRYITLYGQQFVPDEERKRILLPLTFCRHCGQEYYAVRRVHQSEGNPERFLQRTLMDNILDDDSEAGFLYTSTPYPWPATEKEIIEKIPDNWCEEVKGTFRLKSNFRKKLPETVFINLLGQQDGNGQPYQYVPAPFQFCLKCGVAHGSRQRSDFPKLTDLSSGGRSSATTILSLATVLALREGDLDKEARKLLSFTDNRQDASLQAGHFNDFLEVGLLRGALCKAVEAAGEAGLRHDELTQHVFDKLDLPLIRYASDHEIRFQAKVETEQTLRDILGYRLYHDLRRGWRINAPNLEQCGLLEIHYLSLDEVCEAEDIWETRHDILRKADKITRRNITKILLDHIRQQLAIKVDYLDSKFHERLSQRSNQRLIPPWAMDEGETLTAAPILYPRSKKPGDYQSDFYLSSRGAFGQYLRKRTTFPDHSEKITLKQTEKIIIDLLEALRIAGLVECVREAKEEDSVNGYQVLAASFVWMARDGSKIYQDPLRTVSKSKEGLKANSFFLDFYRNVAATAQGITAREHTAQVPNEIRQEREDDFRDARLPILYCSPTMELGVDIAQLNVVNMRNVPPTPANYAQRSGRAGRSGQPAFVFSYCTTLSSHDQFFFRHPDLMVSGAVSPPRIDLTNKDLLESHIQAVWLAETNTSLGNTLNDLLDIEGECPSMELLDRIRDSIRAQDVLIRAKIRSRNILATIEESLINTDWYSENWLEDVLNQAASRFDRACDRWRGLHRSALEQFERQNHIISDASRSSNEKNQAKRMRSEAETQLDLLTNSKKRFQSDFYSYRYFASEGFLPGYNFPRLPLSAFIPARRMRDEFLSRPRFLAISEFGPRAIIYHEGSRYIINRVILPVEDTDQIVTRRIKLCPDCGYLHVLTDEQDPDLCQKCNFLLSGSMTNLFRMENVSTKRRDRINCDEEERVRLGYEIQTGVRFAEYDHHTACRTAEVKLDDKTLAELSYGDRANLWRINLGWARRKEKERYGFVLDMERGYWKKNENIEKDEDDPMSAQLERVIPYVEDHRNCLLLKPSADIGTNEAFASLEAALKKAIQITYHLEDMEIAVEPLPNHDNRKMVLFYEASEGGAGVLRQLVDDNQALAGIAKQALQLCHFDPDSGEDLGKSEHAGENCEAACYDCLMSYSNQRDHELLDRKSIRDFLLSLAKAEVATAPADISRSDHLQQLTALCQSTLERSWLQYLENCQLRLPSHAQTLFTKYHTQPDFVYDDSQVAIYVDGPHHEYADRQTRDKIQTEAMEDAGWIVIRFGYKDDWTEIIDQYPQLFGRTSQ